MESQRRGRLIDFDQAVVITPMIEPPQPRLVVSGTLPHPEMEVTLVPLVYVSSPPYWGIQVVGTLTGEVGPHPTPAIALPYSVELDLAGVTGSVGVEVIGASRTEQLAVPTAAAA
jgi:hypothetical protein